MRMMVFFILTITAADGWGNSANDHCKAPETSVFSCQTKAKKWINLCHSPEGGLQYRFGKPDHVELRYPDDPKIGTNQFKYAHYSRYQTERYEITFSNHGSDYAIFDYRENRQHHAGVRVGENTEILCVGIIKSALAKLQTQLVCDADNALNGGNCGK